MRDILLINRLTNVLRIAINMVAKSLICQCLHCTTKVLKLSLINVVAENILLERLIKCYVG